MTSIRDFAIISTSIYNTQFTAVNSQIIWKKRYSEAKTSSCIINESWIDVILLAFFKFKSL